MDAGPHLKGLLHVDAGGEVSFAVGLGEHPTVRALARDGEWMADLRSRRLAALNIAGQRLIVARAALNDGDTLLISDSPAESVFDFVASVDFAYDIFQHIISDPFDAMTVVDSKARVAYLSPVHESFFGLENGQAAGRPVREVIENTRLHKVLQTGKPEVGHVQHMRGSTRIVTRTPIRRDETMVGAIGRIMFKGPEQLDSLNRRINALESEVEFYRREAAALRRHDYGLSDIIGESAPMRKLKQDIVKVAPLNVPVLITGQSGAGKELVAQALHRLSPRRDARLIMVNAAALPAPLVESELFGYESGAFTGANRNGHRGKFEHADKGTLFLDEIGDMPVDVQAKLLRVLQDGIVEKVGGNEPVETDFRLISATNRDLDKLVEDGQFRLDLFYRVSPVVLEVPPLKNRLDDIPALAAHFLDEFCERQHRRCLAVAPEVHDYLAGLSWPGNVRQLKHEIERAAIFANGERLTADDLRGRPAGRPTPAADARPTPPAAEHGQTGSRQNGEDLKDALDRMEGELIRTAMGQYQGNKKRVAEELGISRSYLYKRLGEIDPPNN